MHTSKLHSAIVYVLHLDLGSDSGSGSIRFALFFFFLDRHVPLVNPPIGMAKLAISSHKQLNPMI